MEILGGNVEGSRNNWSERLALRLATLYSDFSIIAVCFLGSLVMIGIRSVGIGVLSTKPCVNFLKSLSVHLFPESVTVVLSGMTVSNFSPAHSMAH